MEKETSMPTIAEIAAQLSNEANADADAIQSIIVTAIADIEARLVKYKDGPHDIARPALSNGRNAVASLRIHVAVKADMMGLPGGVTLPE